MTKNHPYKIGDIVKFRNGPYVEYLGPSPRSSDETPLILCRYVKSNHGVPIVCRTRHHKHENYFKKFDFVGENRKWQCVGWIPPENKHDSQD